MTNTLKLTALIITTGLFASLALAVTDKKSAAEYQIRMLKDCEVVAEQSMTASQVRAYQALKEQEQLMAGLEAPIKEIESQMHEYSAKIEELAALAVQETETSLHINKTYMKQQEAVAEQLNQLVSAHQKDFDALNSQGHQISKVARVFEKEIESSTVNIDHDQIQIIGPDSKSSDHSCYSDISHI